MIPKPKPPRLTPEALIKRSLLIIFLLIWLTGAGLTLSAPVVRYFNIPAQPDDPTGSLLVWVSADNLNTHPYFFNDLRAIVKDWIATVPPTETVYLLFTDADNDYTSPHARHLIHLSWIWVYPRPLVSLNVELDGTNKGAPAFIPQAGDGVVIAAGPGPLSGRDCLDASEGLYLCH